MICFLIFQALLIFFIFFLFFFYFFTNFFLFFFALSKKWCTKKLFASQKSFFSFFAFLFKKSRIKKSKIKKGRIEKGKIRMVETSFWTENFCISEFWERVLSVLIFSLTFASKKEHFLLFFKKSFWSKKGKKQKVCKKSFKTNKEGFTFFSFKTFQSLKKIKVSKKKEVFSTGSNPLHFDSLLWQDLERGVNLFKRKKRKETAKKCNKSKKNSKLFFSNWVFSKKSLEFF